MRSHRRLSTLALFSLLLPATLHADPLQLVASDEHGVTLRLTVGSWQLDAPQEALAIADGRRVLKAPGLRIADLPGRPQLPYASALLAVPPGARVTVRVIGGDAEEVREGVRLTLAGTPAMRNVPGLGDFPARDPAEPILDGPWPAAPVEAGEPFTLRRQRIVAVTFRPFRYDEAARRLWARRSLLVRVDFVGSVGTTAAPAGEDRGWEPVLREGLINYEQGRSWRTRAPMAPGGIGAGRSLFERAPGTQGMAGGAALNENPSIPEVRVRLDSTGVYRFSYAVLAPFGYPAATPIPQVSVHRHEFLEGSAPPDPSYATIELPIEVVEEGTPNGVFDGTDYILVYAQSWADRSRPSIAQRTWGSGEVVYATAVAAPDTGLRVATRDGWRGVTGLTPLASYPWTQRWERNLAYLLAPNDTTSDPFHWNSVIGYYSRPDTFEFETNHLDTTRPVRFSLTWQGRTDATHYDWAQIHVGNGPYTNIADSLYWFGKVYKTVSATLPGTGFGEGNVNRMRTWGKTGGGPPDPTTNARDVIGVDYFDATYWRRYRALIGYLGCNSGDASGVYEIRATGYSSTGIHIYDVTDSLNPTRLLVDASHILQAGFEYDIEFQDSTDAASPRRYIVFSNAKAPPPENFSAVTRRQLYSETRGDYLIIVPEAFLPAVQPLANLHGTQGLAVIVSPLEAVNDEFNGGRKSAYSIKRYLRRAYDHLGAKFAILIGDASLDPQNFSGESSTDWVPTQKILGPVFFGQGFETVACDPWYVCFEGGCNINGSTPTLQDMFLGRLPVQSLQQAQDVIAKIVAYDSFAPDQTWRNRVILHADDAYSEDSFFGASGPRFDYCHRGSEEVFRDLEETVASVITSPDSAGLQRTVLDRFYMRAYLPESDLVHYSYPGANGDTCRESRSNTELFTRAAVTPALISKLNQGCLWWNFQGHANHHVLTHESVWQHDSPDQGDKDQLANDGKPFIFSAFSCHANEFARVGDLSPSALSPSLGEELVTLPNRGSIASWASTGYELLPGNSSSHINVEWARAMFFKPPHDEYLGDRGARVVLGETIGLALLRYLGDWGFVSPYERGVGMTYNLLGDPATRISIGSPQTIVKVNDVPVQDGVPVRLHTSGPAVTVDADLVSNTEITSITLEYTDATGTVTIPASDYTLSPAFPDTAAAGLGGRRYHLTYATSGRPFSHSYTIRTVDRYGLPAAFRIVFQFLTVLRQSDRPVSDGDVVASDAALSLLVISPRPLVPSADLKLSLDQVPLSFTAAPAPGDTSGGRREWVLTWLGAPYAAGDHALRLEVTGGTAVSHFFKVQGGTRFENAMAFPNPFDDDLGTRFSFTLSAGSMCDLQIRVYTLSGRLVYERIERGLLPGYHQLAWDGRDADGDKLGNGIYLYRMLATSAGSKAETDGRLVKLRKPRRAEDVATQ